MSKKTKKATMECGNMKADAMDMATNCGGGGCCCDGKKNKKSK